MPVREPAVLQGTQFALRHVGPRAAVFPDSPGRNFTVGQQTQMVSRPLPMSNIPSSPDFVSGSYILRLLDAGEGTLVFPNKNASDGVPWRQRFNPSGHLQFVEIYMNGELEFVGVIDQVTPDAQQVQVHLSDGWFLLRKAYERDWTTIASPRQVVDRATRVWRGLVVDDFPYLGSAIPGSQWTTSTNANSGAKTCGASFGDAGYADPGFGTTGSLAWTNSTGLPSSSAATCSTSAVNTFVVSQGIRGNSFGFSIPSNATITGILVAIEMNGTGSATGGVEYATAGPRLAIGGTINYGTQPSSATGDFFGAASPSWSYWGGATDLWNTGGLTYAQVNDGGFGAGIQGGLEIFGGSGTIGLSVTTMQITVYYTQAGSTAVQVRSTDGLSMNVSSVSGNQADVISTAIACPSPIWTAETTVFQLPTGGAQFDISVYEDGYILADLPIVGGVATLTLYDRSGVFHTIASITPTAATSWDLRLESDGEWISGYCNGQLVGTTRRPPTTPSTLGTALSLYSFGTAASVVVSNALLEAQVPLLSQVAGAPASPSKTATAGTDNGGVGSYGWNNVNNIASAGLAADCTIAAAPGTTHYLFATNFGFSIPTNATITGVQAVIPKSHSNVSATCVDNSVRLIVSGAVAGNSKADGSTNWATSTSAGTGAIYGDGPLDSWGNALTPAIVNAANFGVAISATQTVSVGSAYIWGPVLLIVYYYVPTAAVGDYALPGDASTYPWGGLHGRYYNDADLGGYASHRPMVPGDYQERILAPSRSQAYGTASPAQYAERQDAGISFANSATPTWAPTPGVASTGGGQVNFSVQWFGAIWLQLASGNYGMAFTADDGVRVWVGKTGWGEQIIDGWVPQGATTYNGTVSASALGAQNGWYPIVVEYFQGGSSACAQLYFTPPASYTDPGGTALTGSAQVIVPATSLSPLGCIDQRFQGISHYDMLQQALLAAGYQATCKPQRLESGAFPGIIVPREIEGTSTAVVLEPADLPRDAGEGILNYSSTLDASDFVSSLQGNGAGLPTGTTGQLQTTVYDPTTLLGSLFDVQGWQDFSDASYPELLHALLNSQLGLRLDPWQLLSADPVGKPRQAFTWPLPGLLSTMLWHPGDALRVHAREINVYDGTPRQMLMVTRNILPYGIASTQATFANRPRNSARTLKQGLFSVSRIQRNYQRSQTTLSGVYAVSASIAAAGGFGEYSSVMLSPGDIVVSATARIASNAGTSPSIGLEVVGVDVTTQLGGPWGAMPLAIDLTGLARGDAQNTFYVRPINKNPTNTVEVELQVSVDVLR